MPEKTLNCRRWSHRWLLPLTTMGDLLSFLRNSIYSFIYLSDTLHREKEWKKRKVFRLLVHFPNGHNGQNWAEANIGPGASSKFRMSAGRVPSSWVMLHYFAKQLAQCWITSGAARHKQVSVWSASTNTWKNSSLYHPDRPIYNSSFKCKY